MTFPTTICDGPPCKTGPTNSPSSASTTGTSTSSSSGSSSSCSSAPYTSCTAVCSNVTSSGTVFTSQTCSTSCGTVTQCSGRDTTTTTTLNATTTAPACTVSPWWNDPTISAQIASWITQFPPIPDHSTDFNTTFANSTQTASVASTSHSSASPSPSPTTLKTSELHPDYTTVITDVNGDVWSEAFSGGSVIGSTFVTSLVGWTSKDPFDFSGSTVVTKTPGLQHPDYTTVITDVNGDVWSEAFSGGLVIGSTFVTSIAGWTSKDPFEFSGSTVVTRTTTGQPPVTAPPSSEHLLTSTARSFDKVSLYTCEGVADFNGASCTDSWQLETVYTSIPSTSRSEFGCSGWSAFTPTKPVQSPTLECVTQVSGVPTSTIAASAVPPLTSWTPAAPWTPFVIYDEYDDVNPIDVFCRKLTDPAVNLFLSHSSSDTPDGGSAGECFVGRIEGAAILNYALVLQLVYDANGCSSSTDKYANGVNMTSYGYDKCTSAFKNSLADKCKCSRLLLIIPMALLTSCDR